MSEAFRKRYGLACTVAALLALVFLSALLWGCRFPTSPPVTVVVTQTTGTTASPSPSPGPGSQCPSIPRMRVGFFGYRQGCSNPPRNGSGILPLDCIADATATPMGVDGNPVPSSAHGFNITWAATSTGAGRLRLIEDSDNPFNRAVIGDSVGEVQITATLTPPGCSGAVVGTFTVRVVEAGVRS